MATVTKSGSIFIGPSTYDTWETAYAIVNSTITIPTYAENTATVKLYSNSQGGRFVNNQSSMRSRSEVWLSDAAKTVWVKVLDLALDGGQSSGETYTSVVDISPLKGKQIYASVWPVVRHGNLGVHIYAYIDIDITYTENQDFSVSCSSSAGGSLSASATTARQGTTVTLYPSANTGYQFSSYTTSPAVTISNNKFTMPASNVSITANYTKINYSITKGASPSGGGTVTTSKSTANYGDSVTVSQTPASGYYFSGWTTSPSGLISGNAFTMPASNVTITANYLKRSTGSLNSSTLTHGSTVKLTISPDKTTYSHKYRLCYYGGSPNTGWVNVAAGTTSVNISVPDWSAKIPSATSRSGCYLELQTYSGSTNIGTYTISSLTYSLPASVVPTIGTITTSISTSYTTWNLYIQNKCGVRIQTSASGALSSTISSLRVYVNGYSGSSYDKTVNASSIDFTTGKLTVAGTATITAVATDSRGRTATKTTTISVKAYSSPSGSLSVRRVDSGGTDDEMGEYGKFTLTKNYTAVGSNSLTAKLTSQGTQVTVSATSGDLLPGSRQSFSIQQEYTITLTLQDAFETVTINAKLRSAKFLIYVNANGKKLGFMKAASKGGVNDKTIEFDGDSTIYIGDLTLAQYIQSIVSNM